MDLKPLRAQLWHPPCSTIPQNELRRLGVQLPQMLDSGPYAPQGAGAQQQSGGGARWVGW